MLLLILSLGDVLFAGRAGKGAFKDTHPGHLLRVAFEGLIAKTGIKPELVEDIQVGNVLAPGGFAIQARMSAFLAGELLLLILKPN